MGKAWISQDPKQKKNWGSDRASWVVSWYEPDGRRRYKSCGPGERGRKNAEDLARRIEAELLLGTYQPKRNTSWKAFVDQYDEQILSGISEAAAIEALAALDHFQRLTKIRCVGGATTEAVDRFTAARRKEPGKKRGSVVSAATVNKELRHIGAALRVAHEWEYLKSVPRIRMEREPQKLPRFMTPEHFAQIYGVGCDGASLPDEYAFSPSDWWRGLLVTGYMTGWRISDLLSLRRDDLDLEAMTAITRWQDNKGKRDERVDLHPVVCEHLARLASFDPNVFPWNSSRPLLDIEFHRLQRLAGIQLRCTGDHEHSAGCLYYGFHDLRRAFATMNAKRLPPVVLQRLMRHRSFKTTTRYINMAEQAADSVQQLHVPPILKQETG